MQNYSTNYPYNQTHTQTQVAQSQPQNNASGSTINVSAPSPNANSGASGVTINILGAGVYPNGANVNNTYNSPATPGQAYDKNYYLNNMANNHPTVPIGAAKLDDSNAKKDLPKKDIVLLTDEYIQTLENYLRNDNPDIKLMGAKELMKRFREDDSRKNDMALTNLLNLTLQSKYSPVKMVGLSIIQNGWAKGDDFTQQLLAQIQQSKTGFGLDALDAANAALKSAEQTIKVVDNNPPKNEKSDKKK